MRAHQHKNTHTLTNTVLLLLHRARNAQKHALSAHLPNSMELTTLSTHTRARARIPARQPIAVRRGTAPSHKTAAPPSALTGNARAARRRRRRRRLSFQSNGLTRPAQRANQPPRFPIGFQLCVCRQRSNIYIRTTGPPACERCVCVSVCASVCVRPSVCAREKERERELTTLYKCTLNWKL